MKQIFVCVVLMGISSIAAENIFKINISPEEAQQYLQKSDFNIEYAPKTGENPVPTTKNAEGDFIYQGRKLENPGDYVEEHYTAHQYHGQDGLGRYQFGYKDWNQGRDEAKNGNGEVQGTYKYVNPNGKDFIVKYWADSLGFHHEDNRPKVELKPATDTPAVKAAREEHFRKWREAAEAAGVNPDQIPADDSYNGEGQYVSDGSESTYIHVEPKYVPSEEEATSEPKGFFYSFDYSVPLLRNLKEREETEKLRALNRNTRSLTASESEQEIVKVEADKTDDVLKERLNKAPVIRDDQVPRLI